MPHKLAAAPRLLSVAAVATAMAVSTKTIRRLIDRHELPIHRIGHQLRISENDLESFLAVRRKYSPIESTNVH